MTVEHYEKIGAVIYGSSRLRTVMASVKERFAKANGDDAGRASDEAVANAFFERNPALGHLKVEYLRVSSAVFALDQMFADMATDDTAAIEARLSEMRRLHAAVAQIVEDLEFLEYSPALLKAKGESI